MGKWISVEDRLPEIAEMVLVYTKNGVIDTAWRTEFSMPIGRWETYSGRIFRNDKITHWMPLPEPPMDSMMNADNSRAIHVYKK